MMRDLVLSTFTHEYIPKQEAHIKGVQHFAFSVMIYNQYGKVLLQQRAFSKYHSGGLWSNVCCGHPARVDDITSICEEAENLLQEEMGGITPLTYKSTSRYNFHCSDLIENEVDSIFEGIYYKSAISVKPDTRIRLNENFLLIKKYLCPWSIMYKSKKFVDKGRITTADDFSAIEKYCIYASTPFDSSLVTVWVNDIIAYFLSRVISREYITIREAWKRMNSLVQGDKTLSPKIILLLVTTINEYKILDILND